MAIASHNLARGTREQSKDLQDLKRRLVELKTILIRIANDQMTNTGDEDLEGDTFERLIVELQEVKVQIRRLEQGGKKAK